MADGKEDGGTWWGDWIQTAKEKSASAFAMVKRDLSDYTCTMQQDTSQVIALTTEKMKETIQKDEEEGITRPRYGFTSFLEDLTRSLVVEAEDKYAKPIPVPTSDPMFDRSKARLHAVQVDAGTYCNRPTGEPELFKEWVKTFSMDQVKGDISELLVSKVEVRALYTKLVPSEISHADFWQRYFYKVNQLHLDEARKLALMKRAERAEVKEDSISWDDSDDEEMKMKGEHSPKSQDDSAKERLSPEYVKVSAEPLETQIELRVHPSSDVNEEQTEKAATDVNYTEVNKSIPENNISVKQDEQDSGHEAVRCSDIENVDSCEKDPVVGKVEERDQDLTKETEVNKSSPLENVTTEPLKEQKSDSDSLKSDNVAPADRLSLEISVKEKGDVVVVNPDRESPSSESDGKKDAVSTDDDWEQDFDVELTEEDMKAADEIAKKLNLSATDYTKLTGDLGEDWENWE